MRARDPFSLVKRTRGKCTVWVYRTYAPDGRRLEYSTGLFYPANSKTAARAAVLDLYRAGKLVPDARPVTVQKNQTFKAYAEHFYDSDGTFAAKRAETDNPFSSNYLAAGASAVKCHLIPAFGSRRLADITLTDVEAWALAALGEKKADGTPKAAKKSIRNMLGSLSTILAEAARQGIIPGNAAAGSFLPSKAPRVKRDALRPDEIRKLFDPSADVVAKVWKNNIIVRSACLVSITTGARIGEIRAIRGGDVHAGWLEIARSWSVTEGEKSTKSSRSRIAPLPSRAQELLGNLVTLRGAGLLFTLNGKAPIAPRYLQSRFGDAIEAIGIDEAAKKARGLSFHSLRATYNTVVLAANVPEAKLRFTMGHETKEMTDRYTAFTAAELTEVLDATTAMLEAPKKRKVKK